MKRTKAKKAKPSSKVSKGLLKKERGVWVYQGEPTRTSIIALVDQQREKRSRELM
ncbi:MAG: hypothetical protein ACLPWF_08530 [Bryobacteraceae bacterium]